MVVFTVGREPPRNDFHVQNHFLLSKRVSLWPELPVASSLFKTCRISAPPNDWHLPEGTPAVLTALRKHLLDLKAGSLVTCQYLF
ncbi:hypothetical protein I79_015665 [Cricetulus griseus]|uniref:Uncharacterized protein n=1 Tax=Cricetulus griseus TaxID=10029 RepID=G3HXE3_CRIGR|nr:hypothetical protein I79_015665 [Cricetulus griseus]